MIKVNKLKSKNPFLKVIFEIINLVISLVVGILNLIISFGKWFYNKLIKEYKYEFLYIAIISAICIYFSILGLTKVQLEQMYTWMGNSPSFVFIILLVLSVISFVFGLIFYILKIFKNKKIDQKYFWYIRVLSYVLTFILLMYLVDFVILDFVSRYNLVTKPTDKTSTYDTIIYFIREYDVNFVDGIKTTLKLALLGTVIGLVLAFLLVSLRILESSPRDNDLIRFIKKIKKGKTKYNN